MNLDLNFTPNSKWIMDLNVKCKTINLLEKNKRKSSGFRVKPRVSKLDTKSTIYERENC